MEFKLKHQKRPFWKDLIYVLLLILIIFICGLMISFLKFVLKTQIIDFIALVIIVLAGTFIVRKQLQEYTYILSEDAIQIERNIGRSEKQLEQVALKDILWIGPYIELPEAYEKIHLKQLTFLHRNTATAIIAQNKKGEQNGILFSPPKEMIIKLLAYKGQTQENEMIKEESL